MTGFLSWVVGVGLITALVMLVYGWHEVSKWGLWATIQVVALGVWDVFWKSVQVTSVIVLVVVIGVIVFIVIPTLLGGLVMNLLP